MKETKKIWPVIGVICALILLLVVGIAMWLDGREQTPTQPSTEPGQSATAPTTGTDPTLETTEPAEVTESTDPVEVVPPPGTLPPTVVIPPQKDPNTGEETVIRFPCKVPGYDLVLEKLAPYEGMYVEDGSNVNVSGVAMLMVRNAGEYPVEYAQIHVGFGNVTLQFDITALPVGEQLVVQEKNGRKIPDATATSTTAMVVQRAQLDMSTHQVQVTDNGDNTLTIRNLTDKMIPTVRVFYKYYMEEENVFVGGIAFTVRITRLGANDSVTVQPSHYTSQTGRVVMVLTYDSEV